jgi:uncharacterized damage-inducible protein DinB
MKTYFLKLINYDQFANKAILKAIIGGGEPEQSVRLMAHLLAAQQVWLNRCKGLPASGVVLWPDWKADTFERLIYENHAAWVDFIKGLEPEDFKKIIYYKSTKGDSYKSQLEDILAHLINHGTHHRAQAGQQLKFTGVEKLPLTDYIFFIR